VNVDRPMTSASEAIEIEIHTATIPCGLKSRLTLGE